MLDIHTHILPGIDDGSRSVEESIAMLGKLAEQGVDTVIATPHFYIDRMNTAGFLEQRAKATEFLLEGLRQVEKRPHIAIGAEVEFYNELYSLDILDKLCLGETKYILVEMPFARWSDYTYQALSRLFFDRNVIPVIAHIERYIDLQKDDVVDRLIEANALIQVNGSFVISKSTRRRALNMIKNGMVCYIGSDCHNLTSRPPNIKDAYEIIRKKLGGEELDTFEYWEERLLENIKTY